MDSCGQISMKTPSNAASKNAAQNTELYTHFRTIIFGDTDAAAIVYTPNFSNYCMEAAESWFKQYLDVDWYTLNTQHAMGTPVVHMEIDFFAPLRAGDLLGTSVEVERIGNSTITLIFKGNILSAKGVSETLDKTVLCFSAKYIFCFTSIQAGGSVPIPKKQLQLLEKYEQEGAVISR